MQSLPAFRVSAALGFLAVALGAFGAHALKETLVSNGTTAIWEKAVLYHFLHAVMLCFLASRRTLPRAPWYFFMAGIVIFSGSLYVMSVTNVRWLGAITPFGGGAFLVGWGWLAICKTSGQVSDEPR